MPTLVLVKSPVPSLAAAEFDLGGDPQVIGRDEANAQILLRHDSVSRTHARVFARDGTFFVEDLGSRNRTFVNRREALAHTPVALKPGDRIRVCDFVFEFRDDGSEAGEMFVVAALPVPTGPADRLRALLALSAAPPWSPDPSPLLARIADALFESGPDQSFDAGPLWTQVADALLAAFPTAERCFVLLRNEAGTPVPKATRCRPPAEDGRFSRPVVRRAMDAGEALVCREEGEGGPRWLACAPLADGDGRGLGAVLLDARAPAAAFAGGDLDRLAVVATLAGAAVERILGHAQTRAQAAAQNQLELARDVQRGFLPRALPVVLGYEFYSHYAPAQTVGGDYYDFVPLPGGKVAVVLGDVAGKGVPAALLAARLSAEVRFCLLTEADPGAAITLLNDQLLRGGLGDRFVTLIAMVLDPADHRVAVVNAGHLSPWAYSAAGGTLGEAVPLDATGLPLGVRPGFAYSALTVALEPGDSVVVFTDGVTDSLDPTREPFGLAAVATHLAPEGVRGPGEMRPRRMVQRLVDALRRHADGRVQFDDIAVVAFGRRDDDDPTDHPDTTIARPPG